MHWRRKWQPTPVFLPGESQGWWSLVGCRLWGCTESDTTEVTQQQQQHSAMYVVLTCIYLLISDIEHFFMYLLAVCISSLEKCLFNSSAYFKRLMLRLSRFSRVQLCATPQTAAHQAPPSLGFSRQEHWSGLPFPSPMHESEK